MYSRLQIGLVTEIFFPNYQSLYFQINSISLIESEEFRETSNQFRIQQLKFRECLIIKLTYN